MTLAGGVVQGLAIAIHAFHGDGRHVFHDRRATPADLTIPLFTQSLLADLIAIAMVVVCAGNLTLLGFMTMQQRRLQLDRDADVGPESDHCRWRKGLIARHPAWQVRP